jgi:hypothetical protein
MKKLLTAAAMASVMIASANCEAGWLDSKAKAIGRGVSNAGKVAGRDFSDGAKHIMNTPIRLGKPNFGYMRDTLNHRPFANDTGELGRHLGGHTTQDLLIEVLIEAANASN